MDVPFAMVVRGVLLSVVLSAGCAEAPVPTQPIAPGAALRLPGWAGPRGDGATPTTSMASAPAVIDGMPVAGPVDMGPGSGRDGARWRTRTLGGPTVTDPVDERLRTPHGDRPVVEVAPAAGR